MGEDEMAVLQRWVGREVKLAGIGGEWGWISNLWELVQCLPLQKTEHSNAPENKIF